MLVLPPPSSVEAMTTETLRKPGGPAGPWGPAHSALCGGGWEDTGLTRNNVGLSFGRDSQVHPSAILAPCFLLEGLGGRLVDLLEESVLGFHWTLKGI